MTLITWHNDGPLFKDGKVATEQGCCCEKKCGRCIVDGEWDCRYTTREECEECSTVWRCLDFMTWEDYEVADCSECAGEDKVCYDTIGGPCGTWDENAECEPCPCEVDGDCPDGKYCCDGECTDPVCDEDKHFLISFHVTNPPAGVSKTCHSNIGLSRCTRQQITRSLSYGPFFGCTLNFSAYLGEGCVLEDITVTRTQSVDCDNNPPEYIEIEEVAAADCVPSFIPD